MSVPATKDDKVLLFYIDEPPITTYVETFFDNYASIPATNLRNHLKEVRQRAWDQHHYPCLGQWGFLDFSIRESPIYQEILDQCKNNGATLIDFGCCFGQDIRQLVYDGVPLDQIRGYDIDSFFIELGYELFRDGHKMQEKNVFHSGNIFDDEFLNNTKPADYIYVGSFIHLFDDQTQRDVCRRLTRLATKAIFGRQAGSFQPGEYTRSTDFPCRKSMRHSPESFTQLWSDVTNHQWQVEYVTLQIADDWRAMSRRLNFVVRKQHKPES